MKNDNNLKGIYLLTGEEEYLLNDKLKKMKKSFGNLVLGINYINLYENAETLISEVESPAFGFEKKMIIVKNTQIFKLKDNELYDNIIAYISNNIKTIQESVVLVFIEKEVTRNGLYKIIEKYGEIYNFERLSITELKGYLKKICNMYNVKISDNNLQLLIETSGTSLQVMINEIRKLIEYTGENGEITEQIIKELSIKELDSIIFDLSDNLCKKNTKGAIRVLHELLYNKEPIQKILIMIYNHFKKLYLVSLAKKDNMDVSEVLKLKPNQTFLIRKYQKQLDYFTNEELLKIIKELINLDYNSKQGKIDINVGLESILAAYCS